MGLLMNRKASGKIDGLFGVLVSDLPLGWQTGAMPFSQSLNRPAQIEE